MTRTMIAAAAAAPEPGRMKLIFLYGLPAAGKLTVAQELAAITGYKLFHNHQVVDLLLTVFPFGSPEFVELREEMWLLIFEKAASSGVPGIIFTFAPEATVRASFIPEALRRVSAAGGAIEFVELTCPVDELKRRMNAPSRHRFRKLTSVELFEQLHEEGSFDASHMPKPQLSIDTSRVTPARAALQIARAFDL